MKTEIALKLAGGNKALAELLGVTSGAISQWGDEVPEKRYWQLRVLKPDWFPAQPGPRRQDPPQAAPKAG